MVSFYLAGKFKEGMQLLTYVNELENLGMKCTHKWMLFEGATRTEKAINDVDGVSSSDFLIAFLTDEDYKYRGTMSEIGTALGFNSLARQTGHKLKKIYVIHPADTGFTCFIHHPDINLCTSYQQALSLIKNDFKID